MDGRNGESFRGGGKKTDGSPVLCALMYKNEFILQMNASGKGLGVVLAQRKNREERPLLYYLSRMFMGSEKNYSVSEKEFVAIIYWIKKLRPYLDDHTKGL